MALPDSLYPPIEPWNMGFLPERDGHSVFYEESGNPTGKPALFLHGGPGAGTEPAHRRFWDPDAYRIVMTDQRGSGSSLPRGRLEANTTWDLVADLERLREHLGIRRWQVLGGSWGSTLALAYAQAHPERVTELILRGLFLSRRADVDWFYRGGGANRLFPDAWEDFLRPIPVAERGDPIAAFQRLLASDDPDVRGGAAAAWLRWEEITSRLVGRPGEGGGGPEFVVEAFARIECHYMAHAGFFEGRPALLDRIERVRPIPATLVHGRYDVVCPVSTAWELRQAWPELDLVIVPRAGHSAFEAGIAEALVAATDRYRDDEPVARATGSG